MNIQVILFAILVVFFFMRGVPMLMSMKVKKMYRKQTPSEKATKNQSREKIIGKQAGEYVDFEEIED